MKRDDDLLTIAAAKLNAIDLHNRNYVDRADVVAWLRQCALESPGQIPANTARALADGLEKMEIRQP